MAAKGCSSYIGLVWIVLMFGVVIGYSLFLDNGVVTTGEISAKREWIRTDYGDWNRVLDVTARYRAEGDARPRYVEGQFDVQAFDRLRVGDAVQLRYLPVRALLDFPLVPSSRFADQNTVSIVFRPVRVHPVLFAWLAATALLLVLWLKARVSLAGWVLLASAPIAFVYVSMPLSEPSPSGPARTATAVVDYMDNVTKMFEGSHTRGMPLSQPYDIAALRFTPEGRTEAVVGVDKVDAGSVAGLTKGAAVPIRYEAANPRVVRLEGGTRTFPRKAFQTAILTGGVFAALLVVATLVGSGMRALGRRLSTQARARLEEARRRRGL